MGSVSDARNVDRRAGDKAFEREHVTLHGSGQDRLRYACISSTRLNPLQHPSPLPVASAPSTKERLAHRPGIDRRFAEKPHFIDIF
jgi:hypothetical protein